MGLCGGKILPWDLIANFTFHFSADFSATSFNEGETHTSTNVCLPLLNDCVKFVSFLFTMYGFAHSIYGCQSCSIENLRWLVLHLCPILLFHENYSLVPISIYSNYNNIIPLTLTRLNAITPITYPSNCN